MPYLEHEGVTRELPPGETVVGSGAQAGWRLQNVGLGVRHFILTVGPDGGTTICPSNTQHVVVVNGTQVPMAGIPLADGDLVTAGSARFLYLEDVTRPHPAVSDDAQSEAYLIDEVGELAYPLRGRVTSIGRDGRSRIHVADPTVSRFHADVRPEAGEYVLYAMGSAGTYVNGQRAIAPLVLEDGDRLEVGALVLRFTSQPLPPGIAICRDELTGAARAGGAARTLPSVRLHALHALRDAPDGRVSRTVVALLVAAAIGVLAYLLAR